MPLGRNLLSLSSGIQFFTVSANLLIPDSTNVDDEVVGEVSVQVDLFTQAGSGEHKVTVKGSILVCSLSQFFLQELSFQLLLLMTLSGQAHQEWFSGRTWKSISRVRIFKTKSVKWLRSLKPTTGHQSIMKLFICKSWMILIMKLRSHRKRFFSAFNTASEEQLDYYELHICIRDYCFAREDRLVGVAVLQLKDIVDQVKDFFKN